MQAWGFLLAVVVVAVPLDVAAEDGAVASGPAVVLPQKSLDKEVAKLEDRSERAATVLDEIMGTVESGLPSWLFKDARCVAVIPKVVKVGFIFGARHGKGMVSCRMPEGWSRPAFLSITGGSFGLQIGAQATDFVLVFANERSARALTGDKFTLGGNVSVSAGPTGRTSEASTDVTLETEVYSYSRSKGLFAGVSLEGATIKTDQKANWRAYGERVIPEELLFGEADALPETVAPFVEALKRHDSGS